MSAFFFPSRTWEGAEGWARVFPEQCAIRESSPTSYSLPQAGGEE